MARPQTLRLTSGLLINTDRDHNGRWWITLSNHASLYHRDAEAVRQALRLPAGSGLRAQLEDWLRGLEADDQARLAEVPTVDPAQSWGPEAHDNPVANTKMVI